LFATAALSARLFAEADRYRLFAKLVYPRLVVVRPHLARGYCAEEDRTAIEPVLSPGVIVLQNLDAAPDRQAVDLLRYYAGWNFALNRQLGDELFHPTTLVNFRQRLLDRHQSAVAFQTILDGLLQAGLVSRCGRAVSMPTHAIGPSWWANITPCCKPAGRNSRPRRLPSR